MFIGSSFSYNGEKIESASMKVSELGWSRFLQQWSDHVLALVRPIDWLCQSSLAQEALATGYLGYPGAPLAAIEAVEHRLKLALPPSYKAFLQVSNGWRQLCMDVDDAKLHAVHEIDFFHNQHPDTVEAWLSAMPEDYAQWRTPDEKYFYYGPDQDSTTLRDEYLLTALAISEDVEAAVYLLNPQIITPAGEWEAWYFGYKLPGANRYRSFEEMMEAEYLRIIKNLESASQ